MAKQKNKRPNGKRPGEDSKSKPKPNPGGQPPQPDPKPEAPKPDDGGNKGADEGIKGIPGQKNAQHLNAAFDIVFPYRDKIKKYLSDNPKAQDKIAYLESDDNDVRWWTYLGMLPVINGTPWRPLTNRSLYTGQLYKTDGTGDLEAIDAIPHVARVQLEPVIQNMDPAILTITVSELKEDLQKFLNYNQPYKFKAVMDYLLETTSVNIVLNQYERGLRWYKARRGDMPDLPLAFTTTYNTSERGMNDPQPYAYLTDINIADTAINWQNFAISGNKLVVPAKLNDYIEWLFNSAFIDESSPNPTLYFNTMDIVPIYNWDAENNIPVVKYTIDMRNADLRVQLKAALDNIHTNYATVLADLQQAVSDDFRYIRIPYSYDDLVPYTKNDYEYWNWLKNAYTYDLTEERSYPYNTEYIRFDTNSEKLTDAESIGLVNALASTLSGASTIFKVTSMGVFVDNIPGGDIASPTNGNALLDSTSDNADSTMVALDSREGVWYVIDSNGDFTTTVVTAGTSLGVTAFNASHRYTSGIDITPASTMTIYFGDLPKTVTLPRSTSQFEFSIPLITFLDSDNHTKQMQLNVRGNFQTSYTAPLSAVTLIVYDLVTNAIDTTYAGLSVTNPNQVFTVQHIGYTAAGESIYQWNNKNSSVVAAANTKYISNIQYIVSTSATFYYAGDKLSLNVAITVPTDSVYFGVNRNPVITTYITQTLGHHIPVYGKFSTLVTTRGSATDSYKLEVNGGSFIMKEAQTPQFVSKASIRAASYTMMLGLWSMKIQGKNRGVLITERRES